ncbi:MAG: MBL fold metallo-hydrolase, partial [Firmicutes bacterium]|nr:MBL fold metallo-hydrolase [Bacillota bacterium]
TTIFQNCDPSYLDDEARAILARHVNPLMFDGLLTATTSDDSKAINVDNQPKVIISASGMCDAGRIRHHLKYNLWRPESLVLFVGYQADGTLGRLLLDGADSVKILGEKVAVKAEIINMPGVSGHADRDGLLDWLGKFQQKPGYVFVNHGEDAECGALVQSIHEMFGLEDDSPFSGSVYDLITGQYTYKAQGVPVAPKEPVPEQQPITQAQRAPETPHAAPEPHQAAPDSPYWRMLYSADALLKTLHTLGGAPSKELARIQREIEALTREVKR